MLVMKSGEFALVEVEADDETDDVMLEEVVVELVVVAAGMDDVMLEELVVELLDDAEIGPVRE